VKVLEGGSWSIPGFPNGTISGSLHWLFNVIQCMILCKQNCINLILTKCVEVVYHMLSFFWDCYFDLSSHPFWSHNHNTLACIKFGFLLWIFFVILDKILMRIFNIKMLLSHIALVWDYCFILVHTHDAPKICGLSCRFTLNVYLKNIWILMFTPNVQIEKENLIPIPNWYVKMAY